ncbi:hypothetical protein D9M69_471540 [compost metagenome]
MSTKRMRVPCLGGGSISGPSVGSAALSTGAGVAAVLQTSWNTVPGIAVISTTVGSGPLLAMMALPSASWPVTTRWMGGKLMACPSSNRFSVQSSKIATARVQPAEAPRILCGKQLMKKPVGGSTSRLCSFSMWQ